MQAFTLDRSSGIPVGLQLQAQIKYQIAAGLLYPGDQLPPLRDLAAGLSINLNTVVRAVEELVAEGYLYGHQGKGIFVSEEASVGLPGAALRSLLAGVLGPAQEWNLSAEEIALAVLAHGQMARPPQAASHRLLLVGTAGAELRLIRRELERALPWLSVVTALPEEASRSGAARLAVTTLFHSLAGTSLGGRVITLAGPTEQESLARLQSLPAGAAVTITAGDWVQAARIRQSLELGGLSHLRFTLAVQPAALSTAAAEADFLLAPQSGRHLAREAQAVRPDLPILVEPATVTEGLLALIRQALSKPEPPKGVQLRSSWV